MKFALVNGQRQEAQPSLSGKCPACDQAMVARCGEKNVWHWAHKGRCTVDHWWENETEWHRAWKGLFPQSWQEVVHRSDSGEKHIADVKTDQGWVIEFQHSHIKPDERRSRDAFYSKLVWVVNGARLKRSRTQFINVLEGGTPIGAGSVVRVPFSDECAILRDWVGGSAPVFIDFGGEEDLWWILKGSANGPAYVAPFPRGQFFEIHRVGATEEVRDIFEKFVNDIAALVSQHESNLALNRTGQLTGRGFQQYQSFASRRSRRL